MKALETIQILAKIGKVLSRIVYICCVIGVVGCAVGMASLPFADRGLFRLGGVSVYGLIANRSGIDMNGLYPLAAGALLVCVGQAVTAKFAERYFGHELSAGTPFTVSGAGELQRLGILTICVPLGALILAQIVSGVMAELIGCGEAFKLEGGDSVALGVMMLVMSQLCRSGAELLEKAEKESGEETTC